MRLWVDPEGGSDRQEAHRRKASRTDVVFIRGRNRTPTGGRPASGRTTAIGTSALPQPLKDCFRPHRPELSPGGRFPGRIAFAPPSSATGLLM